MIKKTWKLGAVAVALSVMAATPIVANAAPFYETGDAGDLLSTGQAVSSGTSQVFGTLDTVNDVDMFTFAWPGALGGLTTFELVSGGVIDTQLFLFDSAGTLIADNDDYTGLGLASLIIENLAAGNYGVAVSAYDNDPTFTAGVLTGWNGGGSSAIGTGEYQITVLNEGHVNSPIPEPETYAMLLAGLGLMGFVARRRQRKLAAA